jgi:hypothetical protein
VNELKLRELNIFYVEKVPGPCHRLLALYVYQPSLQGNVLTRQLLKNGDFEQGGHHSLPGWQITGSAFMQKRVRIITPGRISA